MKRIDLIGIDVLAFAVSAIGAVWLRDNLTFATDRLDETLLYVSITTAAALLIIPFFGTHRDIWRYSGPLTFVRVGIAAAVVVLATVGVSFAINRLDGVARSVPLIHLLLAITVMSSLRLSLCVRQSARPGTPHRLSDTPPPVETVLLYGVSPAAELYIRSVQQFAPDRVQIVGIVGRTPRHASRLFCDIPVLGTPEDAAGIVRDLAIHGVVVTRILLACRPDELSGHARTGLSNAQKEHGIVVENLIDRIAPVPGDAPAPARVRTFDSVDLRLTSLLAQDHLSRPYWRLKRIVDIAASALLLVTLAPLFALVYALVRIDIGAPVLFWQQRPGRFGRPFRVYKFRTMRPAYDADGRVLPDAVRSTMVGRFLRKTRLDELPQLWNILLGDMSFVGPRPLLPVDQSPEHSARLAVRPGLTGWAQVNGGRSVSADDKAAMDIWYIRNASLMLDLRIAVSTIDMVVAGERTNLGAIRTAWHDLAGPRAELPVAAAVTPRTA